MPDHRFHTPEPVELEVKIPSGDIEVTTVDGDESLIVLEGSERLIEQTTVELHGRRLVVDFQKKGLAISLSGGLRVRAMVPHSSSAELATASADMALTGRYAKLKAKSASGDLHVIGDVDEGAAFGTVSGDVRLQRVGGDLGVKSVSGDLFAETVGGSVDVKSVSGDVRIEEVRDGRVTIQSVSGDIEIGVAPGTNLDVDAGSVSGDLASEVPLGSEPAHGEPGPTVVVRGKTVSGDFRVFRAA